MSPDAGEVRARRCANPAVKDPTNMSQQVAGALGPYTLTQQLGTNGTLVSWQGFDANQTPAWVVGVPCNLLPNRGAWDHFVAESQVLRNQPASRVAALHACGEDGGYYWAAYEWMAGSHLGKRAQEQGLPIAPTAMEWMAQAAEALATLGDLGLTHRLISPASIFVNDFEQVKLLHAGWGGMLLHVHGGVANPSFMSVLPFVPPEVIAGQRCDGAADVYGLGATLYYMLCGMPPYWADEPLSLCDAIQTQAIDFKPPAEYVPAEVVELLQELLARDPDDRPANLPALAERLRAVAAAAFGTGGAETATDTPLSPDNQNYGGGAHHPPPQTASTQAMTPAPMPPGPPPDTDRPSQEIGVRQAVRRSAAAVPPPMATPASTSGMVDPLADEGVSAEDKRRYAIMAVVGILLVAGVGFGIVSFAAGLKRSKDKQTIGVLDLQAEIDRQAALMEDYFKTRSKLTRIAGYNVKYHNEYGTWAKKPSDLASVGALTVEMLDSWSNTIDIRGEYVVTAGADKAWDTEDDMYIDSSSGRFGGYEPAIKLEGSNPLFGDQFKALAEMRTAQLYAKYEYGENMSSMMGEMERLESAGGIEERPSPGGSTGFESGQTRDSLFGGKESEEAAP